MSYYSNAYNPYPRAEPPKRKRSLALLLVVVVVALLLLVSVPIIRFSLVRMLDEFGVTLSAFSLIVFRYYPEALAVPIMGVALLMELVGQNATAKNICNGCLIAALLMLGGLIALGFAMPMLQLMQGMAGR